MSLRANSIPHPARSSARSIFLFSTVFAFAAGGAAARGEADGGTKQSRPDMAAHYHDYVNQAAD